MFKKMNPNVLPPRQWALVGYPGSGKSTKTLIVELDETDACCECHEYPTIGLWARCWGCDRPVCDRCAVQAHDGHFCRQCAHSPGLSE